MKIFDNEIKKVYELLESLQSKNSKYEANKDILTEKEQMILKWDMIYELGGSEKNAICNVIVTEDETLVPQNEICLYGPDLKEIEEDTDYAKILIVRFREGYISKLDEKKIYTLIRKISYLRYKVHMCGFMPRISTRRDREPVRVDKNSVSTGLSIFDAGNSYIKRYLEQDGVVAVKTVFVTDKRADYKKLKKISDECENITASLDHILSGMVMDCSTCNLKEVCDEVDDLRSIHRKISDNTGDNNAER